MSKQYVLVGKGPHTLIFAEKNAVVRKNVYRFLTSTYNPLAPATDPGNVAHERILRDAKRGIAIQQCFSKYPQLTAYILEQSAFRTESFSDLPASVQQGLLLHGGGEGRTFVGRDICVQQLDDGQVMFYPPEDGGPYEDTQLRSDAFSLIWFLHIAQAEFGFRHHNLKQENINIVTSAESFNLQFNITLPGVRQYDFTFATKSAPKIVDFDFASVLGTEASLRNRVGTYATMPPELCCAMIAAHGRPILDSATDMAYDWFSLGCCLFGRWFGAAPRRSTPWAMFYNVLQRYTLPMRMLIAGIMYPALTTDALVKLTSEYSDNINLLVNSITLHALCMGAIGMPVAKMPLFGDPSAPLRPLHLFVDYVLLRDAEYVRIVDELVTPRFVDRDGQVALLARMWNAAPQARIFTASDLGESLLFAPLRGIDLTDRPTVKLSYEARARPVERADNDARVKELAKLVVDMPELQNTIQTRE
jgi:hypothetical protein